MNEKHLEMLKEVRKSPRKLQTDPGRFYTGVKYLPMGSTRKTTLNSLAWLARKDYILLYANNHPHRPEPGQPLRFWYELTPKGARALEDA